MQQSQTTGEFVFSAKNQKMVVDCHVDTDFHITNIVVHSDGENKSFGYTDMKAWS